MSGKRRRRGLLRIHRYLGLTAGSLLVLTSLSGSLIVFGWSIDAWINRAIMTVEPQTKGIGKISVDRVVQSAREVMPLGAELSGVSFPRSRNSAFRVNYSQPGSRDGYEIFVHPFTGEVLGQRLWGDFDACCSWHGPIMAVLYRFHDSLWLGDAGLVTVGTVGMLTLLSLVTGVWLRWPGRGRWRSVLTIRRRASVEKCVFDIHTVLGFGFGPILFVILSTGVCLSFPDQSRALLGWGFPLSSEKNSNAITKDLPDANLTLERIVAIAETSEPRGQIDYLSFPEHNDLVFEVSKHAGDEPMAAMSRLRVAIDGRTGAILAAGTPSSPTTGDRIDEWILALHSGEGLGLAGQCLALMTGLVPTVLYVTGVIRWRQKRRAAR